MEPVKVDAKRCKGCGLCVEFCPRHLLKLSSGLNPLGYHAAEMHEATRCTACALCAEVCPEAAIEIYRARKSK